MFRHLMRGAIAGAAGTTALNATSYLDMTLTARAPSTSPQQAVDTLATRTGHPIPGDEEEHAHRLDGAGPLAGIAVGVGVGCVAGMLWPVLRHVPTGVAAVGLAAAAMAAAGIPVTALGVSNPATWSVRDWASDAGPHLVYGAVSVGALRLLDRRRL